jgi:hypothetical protein
MTEMNGIKKYGRILRKGALDEELLFENSEPVGWRVAEINVDNSEVVSMSYHDNTPECFFPVEGETEITLALDDGFENCETFLLDKPLLINACVWHGLASKSGQSRIIVIENEEVNLRSKSLFSQRNRKQ